MAGRDDVLEKDWKRFLKSRARRTRPAWAVVAILALVTVAGAAIAAQLLLQWTVTSTGPPWKVASNLPSTVATSGWYVGSLTAQNLEPGAADAALTFTWTATNISCVWVSMNELNAVQGNISLGCTQVSAISIAFTTSSWTVYPTYAHVFSIGFSVQVNDAYSVQVKVG